MIRLLSRGQVLLAIVSVLIVWQIIVVIMHVPVFVLPAPSSIATYIAGNFFRMLGDLGLTMGETLAGFALGSATGIVLALLVMRVKPAEALIMPIAVAISMVPTVAFVPLALIWFGVGMSSKIAIAALAVSFPVLINTLTGLKRPEDAHVDLYRSFGASSWSVLWRLRIPASLPFLANGLRVGFARSTVVVIVTEMLGAYAGIGQVIYQATSQMDTTTVWAAVALSSMISLMLYAMLVGVLRKYIWWN